MEGPFFVIRVRCSQMGGTMSTTVQQVGDANRSYQASFSAKRDLPMPPGRRFAVLTCMDARLDPAKYAGLVEGEAQVIRNAGGRPAMTQSDRSLSRTNCSGRVSGLSSIIPIAEWRLSLTM